MVAPVTAQQLENASQDCQSVEDIVNGPVGQTVTTRLGQEIKTFKTIEQQLDIVFNEAEASATAAQTARTGAESAQTAAETAQEAAETARAGAETAETNAETARTGAESARDLAEQYRDEAQLLANTGDYFAFAGNLTANQATGIDPIVLPADPKIAARVAPFVLGNGAYQRPGLDFTVGKTGDTDTTHLYIVDGSSDLNGVEYSGTVQIPSSLTNINAPTAGSVVEGTLQNGIVSYFKMKAADLATTAANFVGDKIASVAGVIAYIESLGIKNTYFATYGSAVTLAAIPFDTSIPQKTEGTEIFSFSFATKRANSKVRIRLQASGDSVSGASTVAAALFVGSSVNAEAVTVGTTASTTGYWWVVGMDYLYSPGTTDTITYKIRIGYIGGAARMNLNFGSSSKGAMLFVEEIPV